MEATAGSEVLDRIKTLLCDRFGIEPDQVAGETRLNDIGIDSFALIELLFLAEEHYKISIPVEDLDITTVSDLVRLVERRLPCRF